jgi:hypothetical protein
LESKMCLSSGVGGTLGRHPGLGRPMAFHLAAAGGYADATRVRATRCFGGNHHHAPGCNRLLTVNATESGHHAQKFRATCVICVTGRLEWPEVRMWRSHAAAMPEPNQLRT